MVGSIYLINSIGIAHPDNLAILHKKAAALDVCSRPWVLGGDWACTPDELTQTGWLKLVGGIVVAPPPSTPNKLQKWFPNQIVKLNILQPSIWPRCKTTWGVSRRRRFITWGDCVTRGGRIVETKCTMEIAGIVYHGIGVC